MDTLKIKSYVESSNVNRISQSLNKFCRRADCLFGIKHEVTGLLPNSIKKSKTTGLTTTQLIELILKNA